MKKLLNIIGAVGMLATVSTSVIACSPNDDTTQDDHSWELANEEFKNAEDMIKKGISIVETVLTYPKDQSKIEKVESALILQINKSLESFNVTASNVTNVSVQDNGQGIGASYIKISGNYTVTLTSNEYPEKLSRPVSSTFNFKCFREKKEFNAYTELVNIANELNTEFFFSNEAKDEVDFENVNNELRKDFVSNPTGFPVSEGRNILKNTWESSFPTLKGLGDSILGTMVKISTPELWDKNGNKISSFSTFSIKNLEIQFESDFQDISVIVPELIFISHSN